MSLCRTHAACHVKYKILNAPVKRWPFSHFYIENVFPQDFYSDILASLPPHEDYSTYGTSYKGRKFANPTKLDLFDFLLTEDFLKTVITTFLPDFKARFPTAQFDPKMDLRLVLDGENYSIGPHTDAAWKIVSLLFYLPPNDSLKSFGTSLYTPKDPTFRCPGGPHHDFKGFDRVFTAPFLPNSCFGFFKTDYSFHGVEPITIPCRRDVLLWNLYDKSVARK